MIKQLITWDWASPPFFELENWTVLLEYAQTRKLLPNLESMTLGAPVSSMSAPLSTWVLSFGSSVLADFRIGRSLTPRSASLLLCDVAHNLCKVVSLRLKILYPVSTNSIPFLDNK